MRTTIPAVVVAVRPLPVPGYRLELVVELPSAARGFHATASDGERRDVGGVRTTTVALTSAEAEQLRRDGVDTVLGHGCRYDAGRVIFPNGVEYGPTRTRTVDGTAKARERFTGSAER